MKIPNPSAVAALLAGSFALTSCQEDLQPEVDRLTTEVSDLQSEIQRDRERLKSEQERSKELNAKIRELELANRQAENKAREFERDLARYQKREEAQRAAEEAKPDAKELVAAAREKVQQEIKARVTIQGDKSSGFGMIVEADNKKWIYLSPATLSGNTRVEVTQASGTPLKKFGAFELLENGTLARLEITEEPDHAIAMKAAEELKSSSSLLAVDAAMKITEGRAYNVEPESMSADSRIRALAAGTVVFRADSADLLAMLVPEVSTDHSLWPSSYLSSREPASACLRLDQSGTWTAIPIGSFLEEARVLAEADRFTRLITSAAVLRPGSDGISFDVPAGGEMSVKDVFTENKDSTIVRDMIVLSDWLKEKGGRAAPQDVQKQVSGVYDNIKRVADRDTAALTSRQFSPYHSAAAKRSIEWRNEAAKDLARTIASVSP
jgi:hypothetical protein